MVRARAEVRYDLTDLFSDQPEWFATETVPHLLAWLGAPKPPVRFVIETATATQRFVLGWTKRSLHGRLPALDDLVARLIEGRSIQVEQVPQYGAYGLAGAIAAAILRRRVVRLNVWSPPDLLFDATPGALRGIEVAGRSQGGLVHLQKTASEKRPRLEDDPDVAEAWLSLWCRTPSVSLLLRVRP